MQCCLELLISVVFSVSLIYETGLIKCGFVNISTDIRWFVFGSCWSNSQIKWPSHLRLRLLVSAKVMVREILQCWLCLSEKHIQSLLMVTGKFRKSLPGYIRLIVTHWLLQWVLQWAFLDELTSEVCLLFRRRFGIFENHKMKPKWYNLILFWYFLAVINLVFP